MTLEVARQRARDRSWGIPMLLCLRSTTGEHFCSVHANGHGPNVILIAEYYQGKLTAMGRRYDREFYQ